MGWHLMGYLNDCLHKDLYHLAKTHRPLFSLRMGQKPSIVRFICLPFFP
uniref:Uncharacterized protein n=1 Tax=Nelumbo nucifera TaxID=4432 RepID=A0A822ZHD7_NELNU|nr:TPA_asm: hypothetical protein HUJ06_015421 [Nelumbo nucifera]